jgi:anti-sigma factor RsiW
MNCQDCELALGEFADGTLPPDRMEAVAAHVRECARCAAIVTDFTAIRGAARTLEPQMPAAHVWTRIAVAIEQEQERCPWWRLAGGAFAWQPLAAAAVMLMLVVGSTWLAWRDASVLRPVTQRAGATIGDTDAESPADAAVQLAEREYTTAIADLERVAATEGGSLDPETVRVVQANLTVIDQAIGYSRDALKTEPANPVAQDSLFDALRSKVQLLQDTVALINEMRKGNQEGAARIISGMNK